MKIHLINYRKEFSAIKNDKSAFQNWFCVRRYFSGKLICISVKHIEIQIDFRGDFYHEMTGKRK